MVAHSIDWPDLFLKFLGPILSAIAAAFLAARFAVNRFYKEKWWEKRLQSFTEVIEISYRIMKSEEYFLENEYSNMNLQSKHFNRHTPEIEKQLSSQYWADMQDIERISQLSEFTLTMKAAQIIKDFLLEKANIRSAWDENAITILEASESDYGASKKLLSCLVTEAKRELKVK